MPQVSVSDAKWGIPRWSSKGRYMAVSTLWDAHGYKEQTDIYDGRTLAKIYTLPISYAQFAFAPDENSLAATSYKADLHNISLPEMQKLLVQNNGGNFENIKWSADSKYFCNRPLDAMQIYTAKKLQISIPIGHRSFASQLAWHPHLHRLALRHSIPPQNDTSGIKVMHIDGTLLYEATHPGLCGDVAWSACGKYLAYITDTDLTLLDGTTFKELARLPLEGGIKPVYKNICWSPNGPQLFVQTGPAKIGLYDASLKDWVYNLDHDLEGDCRLRFCPYGVKLLLIARHQMMAIDAGTKEKIYAMSSEKPMYTAQWLDGKTVGIRGIGYASLVAIAG